MTKTDGPAPPHPMRPTPSPQRVAAFATGISAESKACVYLIAKGYRILARRFRTPHGEIDVVARHRSGLVFVEVKAREGLADAAYAVTPRQKARIIAAAEVWLMTHPDHANLDCRFDVILIAPKHLPRHLKAAFDLTG